MGTSRGGDRHGNRARRKLPLESRFVIGLGPERRPAMKHSLLVAVSISVASFAIRSLADPASADPPAMSLTMDDLFSETGVPDMAVSPSGRFISAVVRRDDADVLAVYDLTTRKRTPLMRLGRDDVGPLFDARIQAVLWKTDERLLFWVSILPAKGVPWRRFQNSGIRKMGIRLYAIGRDGEGIVRLLGPNKESELALAFNLGEIRSLLPNDPAHILMLVDGIHGRSLFRVDVATGGGEVVEHARPTVVNWWLDLDGKAVVEVRLYNGAFHFYRREGSDRWKQFYKVRLRDLEDQPDYEALGPSDQPDKYYVLARPEGAQRRGVYLYELETQSFGAPIAENATYDIFAATISRDGKRLQHYCYEAHVRVCRASDEKLNAHLTGLRKYFDDSANVYVTDSSQDDQIFLLYVEGPSDPPAWYEYRRATSKIELLALAQEALSRRRMPSASVVEYEARDGMHVSGYLLRPPGAEGAKQLPLIVLPHGGPESRDHLAFEQFPQFLAARGYAVFQPNFRGSSGFGLDYIERGHGEWGRKMQDDITDGVKLLISQGTIDPSRICIVGASYGGYAALAGATFTPELYRCVVSIAGISDLAEFLKSRRRKYGGSSETFEYWVKQIGDPKRDAERIAATSPALHVDEIAAPILLIHGDDDDLVPYDQSTRMKKQLDRSGRKTELVTLEDEGHDDWSDETTQRVFTAIDGFVRRAIGPGVGSAPAATPQTPQTSADP